MLLCRGVQRLLLHTAMLSQPHTFANASGDLLSAVLDRPLRGTPRAYAVFAHCFTCGKNLPAAERLAHALVRRGWGVLRFDFTGLGASEGEFASTTFSSNVSDLVEASAWLSEHFEAPTLLIGHSLGGAAVLRAAAHIPSATAVATIAAPSDPNHVSKLLQCDREQIEREGSAEVRLAGRFFTIGRDFLKDIEAQPMKAAIHDLRRALLVLHAPADDTVGIENASAIFTAAQHPKSFVSLDGANHLLGRPADVRFAAGIIADWAERYLPAPLAGEPTQPGEVTAWGPVSGFTTELTVDEHQLLADEPKSVGGAERGPSPYGYLLSGLGACTVMTLRMYADRKKWPLRQAVCRLRHTKADGVDRITRELRLDGEELDVEQRARLLEIADRCPVHRTLSEGTVEIETREMPTLD